MLFILDIDQYLDVTDFVRVRPDGWISYLWLRYVISYWFRIMRSKGSWMYQLIILF